ncbi:MAG: hypothetical protein ACUVWN_09380 [bacterium]
MLLMFANSTFCDYTIPDNTLVSYNGSTWADRIGDFIFEIYNINVSWTDSYLIFDAYTNFDSDGDYPTPWSKKVGDNYIQIHAYLSDFFIDADRDGTFEYGVVMKDHNLWEYCDIYPSDWNTYMNLGVGLYSVTGRYRPSDFWGSRFSYGKYYSNNPYPPNQDIKDSYTAIKSGSK